MSILDRCPYATIGYCCWAESAWTFPQRGQNSFAAQKNTAKKLIRKNVAKKIVENYRQASGGGHLQPIRA